MRGVREKRGKRKGRMMMMSGVELHSGLHLLQYYCFDGRVL